MNKFEIDKSYISEYDRFLQEFDKKNPQKSSSQLKEIAKHQKIHHRRDEVVEEHYPLNKNKLWKDF